MTELELLTITVVVVAAVYFLLVWLDHREMEDYKKDRDRHG